MPQLPESNLSVSERLDRLVVATDTGCRRSELIADLEVLRSVMFLAPVYESGVELGRKCEHEVHLSVAPSPPRTVRVWAADSGALDERGRKWAEDVLSGADAALRTGDGA